MLEVILMDVTIRNYGEGMTPRANTIAVQVGAIEYYFSYRTLVAFHAPSTGLVARKNDWGATTGKHLNWIDGGAKKDRLDAQAFQAKLEQAISEERGATQAINVGQSIMQDLLVGKAVETHLDEIGFVHIIPL